MRWPKMMIGHSVLPGNQSFGHPDFFRTMSDVRRQNESLYHILSAPDKKG